MEPVNNPYTYGVVCITHKRQVNLGEGHYIIFDIIENNKTSYGKDNNT